jgi:hypothetical protein
MEKDKKQPKEPFRPEDTPSPPQSMRPGVPDENKATQNKPPQQPDDAKSPKKKLLGESEIEIDDETTI